jgi:PKD repeat protein
MAEFHASTLIHCGSEEVRFMAICTGQIPDQLTWNFPGGSPATSTDEEPLVTYTVDGTYTAQLIACHGPDCDTIEHTFTIGPLYTLEDNGLSIVGTPYTEDFEGGFAFPQPNMVVMEDGTPNWQVCDFAGYNSTHCLYMAGETASTADTNEVVFGNFDLTSLAAPTITMKVAATHFPGVQFYYFNLMMRDLCDDGQPVGPWLFLGQPDLAGSNTNAGFVPTTPGQWITVTCTNPGWTTYYPHAEFMLRVVKPWMPGTVDEGLYVDDINIGEADVVSHTPEITPAGILQVFPDPASDHITIAAVKGSMMLCIHDLQGREVFRTNAIGSTVVDVSSWPAGIYLASLGSAAQMSHARFAVR